MYGNVTVELIQMYNYYALVIIIKSSQGGVGCFCRAGLGRQEKMPKEMSLESSRLEIELYFAIYQWGN